MPPANKGWVALGGKSKKESTREEVLNRAKEEREVRNAAKQQQKAAAVIQSAWRSRVARMHVCGVLSQQWQASFSAAAAAPDKHLSAEELSGAVRLALQATLPLASSRSRQLVRNGQPLAQAPACVRGTIALVLRSMGSSLEQDKYTLAASDTNPQVRLAWLVRTLQLCQLCCMTVAASSSAPDTVLDAAAARVLHLLASPEAWTTPRGSATASSDGAPPLQGTHSQNECSSSCSMEADATRNALLAGLKAQPMPVLLAVRRCVQRQQQLQQAQEQPTKQQPASSDVAAAQLQAASMTATVVQRLMGLVLLLLESPVVQEQQQQQQFAERVVQLLLTLPELAGSLPAAIKVRLLQQPVMCNCLLPTAGQLASARSLAGRAAAHCLANCAQLLTGCLPSIGPAQEQQGPSSLTSGTLAHAYVQAAMRLLIATRQPDLDSSCELDSRPPAQVLREGCWMLGTQQHLLPLLQTLQQYSPSGTVLWAGYCVHLLQDTGSPAAGSSQGLGSSVLNVLAFAPQLLPALWQWLARTAGLPLEAPLQATRGLDIAAVARGPEGLSPAVALVMGLFCRSLSQLLLVLDDADLHERQTPFSLGTSRAIASTLNSLVFHTAFPATGGQQQQQPGQKLGQQAGTLQDACSGVLPTTFKLGLSLLVDNAGVVAKAYCDKDARKPFCQPSLWTEPYHNLMARLAEQQQQAASQDGGMLVTTAAVVQALLSSSGLGQEDEGSSSSGPAGALAARTSSSGGSRQAGGLQQSPAAAAAAAAARGAHVPGLRTSALLSLLKAAPQCVPFAVRLELFRQMIEQDKVRGRWGLLPVEGGVRPIKLTVRRDALLEDAYAALGGLGAGVKARLMVTFVNAQGLTEAGLDHGGLMKELLEQVVAAGTQPEYGLFTSTEDTGLLYPNPTAEAIPQGLALLEFLGMMVGKALYEGILLNLSFAPFFVRCLQGGRPGLDDLSGLDATLHTNLLTVKACPPEQVEYLGLTFAAEQQLLGKTVQYDLVPGGDSVPVTASNRLLYVHLLADWHLNARLGRTAAAFAGGLSAMLPPSWLRLFSPGELNQLISGGLDTGVDVDDMAKYARYSNGYSESSHTVKLFWKVVRELTPDQRCALLRFITSTSRAPLGGFKHLQPPLTIHKVDCGASPLALLGGPDVDRLPSASTCYNMLKLPNYKRQSTLKQKLLYAVGSGAGFELS